MIRKVIAWKYSQLLLYILGFYGNMCHFSLYIYCRKLLEIKEKKKKEKDAIKISSLLGKLPGKNGSEPHEIVTWKMQISISAINSKLW